MYTRLAFHLVAGNFAGEMRLSVLALSELFVSLIVFITCVVFTAAIRHLTLVISDWTYFFVYQSHHTRSYYGTHLPWNLFLIHHVSSIHRAAEPQT